MNRWVRRLTIAIPALAILYFVGASIAVALVVSWMLTPGNVDWSGADRTPPTDPFELGFRGDPKVALGLDFQVIHYPTQLGPAEAWLVPAATPNPTWAVYVHGIGGIRENGYRQLSILHEAGIPTLMITYRNDAGAPASERPFYSFGLSEWQDLESAIGWALENGAEEVILVAESMGGAVAGQFLIRSERREAVTAMAFDAPALDVPRVIEHTVAGVGVPFPGIVGTGALWLMALTTPLPVRDSVSLEEVAAFAGPVFVAHGSADRLVPVSISDRLVEARSKPTVYLRTGADHLLSFNEDPARYREEMLGFLRSLRQENPA